MFERVYLGPEAQGRARACSRQTIALNLPPSDGLGKASEDVVEFIAGMTDRFALSYAERLSA